MSGNGSYPKISCRWKHHYAEKWGKATITALLKDEKGTRAPALIPFGCPHYAFPFFTLRF